MSFTVDGTGFLSGLDLQATQKKYCRHGNLPPYGQLQFPYLLYRQRKYKNIKSDIARRRSPDECLKVNTVIGEDELDVKCGGEWATGEDIGENGCDAPDEAHTSYNQNLPSESAGREDPTVQHQNRQLDHSYGERPCNHAAHP